MSEDEWAASFEDHVTGLGGRFMHARPSKVRGERWATATSCVWPDYGLWFPGGDGSGLHLVEVKRNGGYLSKAQREVFASLEAAGCPVHVWKPRDLDGLVLPTLHRWAGR